MYGCLEGNLLWPCFLLMVFVRLGTFLLGTLIVRNSGSKALYDWSVKDWTNQNRRKIALTTREMYDCLEGNHSVAENDSETTEACLCSDFPEGILTLITTSIAFRSLWTPFWRAWVKFQRLMPLKDSRWFFHMHCLFISEPCASQDFLIIFQMHWLWK